MPTQGLGLALFMLILFVVQVSFAVQYDNNENQSKKTRENELLSSRKARQPDGETPAILFGDPVTNRAEFPWMAYLLISTTSVPDNDTKTGLCTSSLISDRHVLTAGHCFVLHFPLVISDVKIFNDYLTLILTFHQSLVCRKAGLQVANSCDVFLGRLKLWDSSTDVETGSTRISSSSVVIHENFIPGMQVQTPFAQSDIAILVLTSTVTFTDNIKPISLPASHKTSYAGWEVTIAGWGHNKDGGSVKSIFKSHFYVLKRE